MIKNFRIVAVLAVLAAPLPVLAHHSFAMFDKSKEVVLKDAVVKDWQWTSPHTWLYVLVPNGTKNPDKISVEGGNPGLMRREGFAKGSMAPGDKITIYMAPLRSGAKGGSLNAVVLPNGKMLGERMKPGA
jgi:hypothetical protein